MARKGGVDRGVTQRKGRKGWWVRLYVHGRERWFRCDTKSQAKTLYGRLKADLREGRYFPEKFAPKQAITLRAWLDRCLAGSTNRGIGNERRYKRRWSLWLGKRLLTELKTEDLRHLQARLRGKMKPTLPGQPPRRRWSDSTINRHFSFLRTALNRAIRDGLITRNPLAGVRFLAEPRVTRFLTDEELARLQALLSPDHWSLVVFAIETGLRREEQFSLRWSQVDLENGVLTLPLPKGGQTRHVPLSETAKAILRRLDSFARSPWVWPSENPATPMDSHNFYRRVWQSTVRRAGLPDVKWHTLRHTAASRRIMAGVDLVAVKTLLGHVSILTTMRYSHLSADHVKQAVNLGSLDLTLAKV